MKIKRELTPHEMLIIAPKVSQYKALQQQFLQAEAELQTLLQLTEPEYMQKLCSFDTGRMVFYTEEEEIPVSTEGPDDLTHVATEG